MDWPVWTPGQRYFVGSRCEFRGVQLVCCVAHASAPRGGHPWQVAGWTGSVPPLANVVNLWAPNGEVERARLADYALGWEDDLAELGRAAATGKLTV